jgi:hypothetical protein
MKLKSFGCSFIFGSELQDVEARPNDDLPSDLTWPAHLAQHLDRTYACYARPGAGNLQILENILNQSAASNSEDLFVIGWSWTDRFDIYDRNYDPTVKVTPWDSVLPADTSEAAKVYYRALHSEYRDKLNSLCYIKLAIDTLGQKQIPFVMTYIDELLFDQRWHVTPAVDNLQRYVKPHMTKFDGLTFLEWSRKNGYPETAHWHPLESAHRAAADLMISYNLV